MSILGEGRWGSGDYILGRANDAIDVSGPMERVFAHGVIVYRSFRQNITVHEEAADQIEIQFATIGDASQGDEREVRRWNYSAWMPGDASPEENAAVREISFRSTESENPFVLCIAKAEGKIWLHETSSGVNHLIPLTNFHNELMLHLRIRDPKIVHNPGIFFDVQHTYSDRDLLEAFLRYHTGWKKVSINRFTLPSEKKDDRTWWKKIFSK